MISYSTFSIIVTLDNNVILYNYNYRNMDIIIYYNIFDNFLDFFMNPWFFFYHGVSLTQSLKINPIVRHMISYLHLVLLGYHGGFLLSTGLIG